MQYVWGEERQQEVEMVVETMIDLISLMWKCSEIHPLDVLCFSI